MIKVMFIDGILRVKPVGKRKRTYNMGTVMLRNVMIMNGMAQGELVHEAVEVLPPDHPALRKNLKKTDIRTVKPGTYKIAYFAGSDFYYC